MEKPISNGSTKRIAVVTGANKGIGLEICRQLASHEVMVILTARDEGRGTEAFENLKNSGASNILFHQLDVADPSSVLHWKILSRLNSENLILKVDILVNNAGVGRDDNRSSDFIFLQGGGFMEQEDGHLRFMKLLEVAQETYETAEECLNINYCGMKRVTEALIPLLLLAKSPRVVNVSSDYGLLNVIPSESIRKAMADVDEQTEKRLDEVLQSFLNDFKEGNLKVNSWPSRPTACKLSKVAMNTYTRILAKRYSTVCVSCVAPGFVKTDMVDNTGVLTAEEGAKGPVMLALLPDGSPSGLFYDEQTKDKTRLRFVCGVGCVYGGCVSSINVDGGL